MRPTSILAAALLAGAVSLAPGARVQADPPGPDGPKIVLETDAQYSGYDVDMDGGGTAYIGWISSRGTTLRVLHLCVLPPKAKACLGGVKTVDALGPSSASGLQVLAGTVSGATLVWFHDTDASVSGPYGGMIATATAAPDGTLGPPQDRVAAPSFGSLKTAAVAPDGQIWSVAQSSTSTPEQLWVYAGFPPPSPYTVIGVPLTAPFFVNQARLAFTGDQAVLAVDWYGRIDQPIAYSVLNPGSSWSGFRKVARTWNVGAFGMATTRHGLRLVASVNNASYRPAVAKWDGSSFDKAEATGERESCTTASHDLVTDSSGRLADVGNACGDIRVSNLPQADRAAYTDFGSGGTVAGGDPQIATTSLGTGWVVWGIQSATGNRLMTVPVLLPALRVKDGTGSVAGKAWVIGPETCLPPVVTKVDVRAKPKPGWNVASKRLELGNKTVDNGKIDGSDLKPGKKYTLTGTVRFVRPGDAKVVTVEHAFRTCE